MDFMDKKQKRIKLLTKNVKKWNRYIKFCLSIDMNFFADLSSADLSSADMRSANLSSANLRFANLRSADMRFANLSFADMRSANLSSADLRFANLRSAYLRSADMSFADMRSADLDFTLNFSCKWLNIKIDSKLAIQMLYHAIKPIQNQSIEDIDEDLKQLIEYPLFKKVCNKFHRVEECGAIE